MVLNYIWVAFFLIAFAVALIKLIVFQDMEVFPAMMQSTFDMARTGLEISIGLAGVMSLWLGLMKIGERGGMVPILSRVVGPFFSRLFPGVPRNHPATGSIIMNFSANILGLDNAATPLGLKAMSELQEINPDKDTASDAQIMFLVLNASGLTIIPISILADRAMLGSVNPTSIFIPTLIAAISALPSGALLDDPLEEPRAVRHERHREAGRVHDVARPVVAEDRVVLVLTLLRVADLAALLAAGEQLVAEVPAAQIRQPLRRMARKSPWSTAHRSAPAPLPGTRSGSRAD